MIQSFNDDYQLALHHQTGDDDDQPRPGDGCDIDREGRLFSYYRHGKTFRRDLASRLFQRISSNGQRGWRLLATGDAVAVLKEAYGFAEEAATDAPSDLRQRLAGVLRWDPASLLAEVERYRQAYQWPPSILPPDRYMSIVLQASTGCSWNKCAFCALYRDRPFQARTPAQFQDHAAKVADLLGQDAGYRQGIFLADGNALSLSLSRLEPLVRIAHATFPNQKLYGFVDVYSGQRADPDKWAQLSALGFHRVYIGMETGLDELLQLLNKPGSRAELADFVAMLKSNGLAVGLIVMVGAGGQPFRQRHADATVSALAAMPLDDDDLVYLSPFLEQAGTEYGKLREQLGLTPMPAAEIEHELTTLTERIRSLGLRVARYDLREFIY